MRRKGVKTYILIRDGEETARLVKGIRIRNMLIYKNSTWTIDKEIKPLLIKGRELYIVDHDKQLVYKIPQFMNMEEYKEKIKDKVDDPELYAEITNPKVVNHVVNQEGIYQTLRAAAFKLSAKEALMLIGTGMAIYALIQFVLLPMLGYKIFIGQIIKLLFRW